MKEMIVLQVTIFGVMALGFFLKKRKIVSDRGQKEITDLVIDIVLPANIITSFLSKFDGDVLKDCIVIALISMGIQLMSLVYGKVFFRKESEDRLKCLAYGIICSNAGFLGNPVAEGVFGSVGLMLASVYLIPQRIMMWSEGLAIFSGEADRKGTLKKVVTHPCVRLLHRNPAYGHPILPAKCDSDAAANRGALQYRPVNDGNRNDSRGYRLKDAGG